MEQTAQLINKGGDQILIFPKGIWFKCSHVEIQRRGKNGLIIRPAPANPAKAKKTAKKARS